jgi:hypothetical protein
MLQSADSLVGQVAAAAICGLLLEFSYKLSCPEFKGMF